MTRHLCGVGLVLGDAVLTTSAYNLNVMSAEAAAFAAGVSVVGLLITARAVADLMLPAEAD